MDSDLKDSKTEANGDGDERRRMARIETTRDVIFSDFDATAPPRTGLAVDMSAGGLRIRTRTPETAGVDIQVELKPKPEDQDTDVILMRGRVVRVTKREDGDFDMGVRLHLKSKGSEDGGLAHPKSISWRKKPTLRKRFRGIEPGPLPVSFRRIGPTPAPTSKRRFKRWTILGALLLLLLLLPGRERERPFPRGPTTSAALLLDTAPGQTPPQARASSGPAARSTGEPPGPPQEMATTAPPTWDLPTQPAALLSQAQAALDADRPADAARIFEALGTHPQANPTQRFIALLGHAQSAGARGERGLALALLRKAQALGPAIPGPWRQRALELSEHLNGPNAPVPIPQPMTGLINLQEAPPDVPVSSEVHLEVDTTDYTLHLIKDGRILKSYPVGLGRNGATPHGEFYIANKITDPDWYNRGDTIPAGDPENPLGKSWMGLGTQGRPTPYGIHPTNEPQSIRQPLSRGCIRMRPDEAQALFRICPLGTRVLIHS